MSQTCFPCHQPGEAFDFCRGLILPKLPPWPYLTTWLFQYLVLVELAYRKFAIIIMFPDDSTGVTLVPLKLLTKTEKGGDKRGKEVATRRDEPTFSVPGVEAPTNMDADHIFIYEISYNLNILAG
ncbi:hypothetical protein HAX54_039409 [Datura stramonium]|uniref:Uncharacterized protein n=1 Tax=Datura stramonium TaxID=4076 RepID=A0ABS8VMQ0_DATST|nr:hypothetical protein [Datura stramonium]